MADATVMQAGRTSLNKPEGKLTGADLNKVTTLDLSYTQISDAGLKEVVKLRQLSRLYLNLSLIHF